MDNLTQFKYNLNLLVRNIEGAEKSIFDCCGVTLSQCYTLIEIGKTTEITLKDLADKMLLDKSTVSRTLTILVNQGLVQSQPGSEDRRYIKIKLTPEGEELYKRLDDGIDYYFSTILKTIPEDKKNIIFEGIDLLINAMSKGYCCPSCEKNT